MPPSAPLAGLLPQEQLDEKHEENKKGDAVLQQDVLESEHNSSSQTHSDSSRSPSRRRKQIARHPRSGAKTLSPQLSSEELQAGVDRYRACQPSDLQGVQCVGFILSF